MTGRYCKAKGIRRKGRFGEIACSYLSKYIFTYMFCQKTKLRKKFGFLMV